MTHTLFFCLVNLAVSGVGGSLWFSSLSASEAAANRWLLLEANSASSRMSLVWSSV